ncbi:MAG: MFS transporter [Pimelobacter sp.]|nr:MFS transporter [Pimelobacter sp.]
MTLESRTGDAERGERPRRIVQGIGAVVGLLVLVEVASGVLQGYYTPIYPQIADHLSIPESDVNWFEAAQLVVSALCVPLLARLADLIGHQRVLLLSTAVTALGSWVLVVAPSFTTFLVGWALQGAYVVWLPLEVAIIHRRLRGDSDRDRRTRRGAAILVGALELSVIVGALTSGQLVDRVGMGVVLALPAIVVTAVFLVILLGIENTPGDATGGIDWTGFALITGSLGLVMAGLVAVRLEGPGFVLAWTLVAAGLASLLPFARYELGRREPLVDIRLLRDPRQWPIQVTAFLFGVPVLGGQIPLSTYAQADPVERGYGLGADAAFVSTLIGVYVVTLAIGAFTLPLTSRLLGVRRALVVSCLLVALGYLLWIPFHDQTWQGLVNMAVAGLGSGALVAALPSAAAAAAPEDRTGFATGMTNATKTVGGAIASSIFAIALAVDGLAVDGLAADGLELEQASAPLSGYLTVWAVCAGAALLAAVALSVAPKGSFSERAVEV